jgi:hypothetical protein
MGARAGSGGLNDGEGQRPALFCGSIGRGLTGYCVLRWARQTSIAARPGRLILREVGRLVVAGDSIARRQIAHEDNEVDAALMAQRRKEQSCDTLRYQSVSQFP